MRKHISLVAAAAIALGGAGFLLAQEAQQDGVRGEGEVRVEREQVQVQRDRADEQQVNGLADVTDREANNIRGTLSSATEAAVEGDLRSMAQRLTTSDEARLSEAFEEDNEQLQQVGQQIRDAFEQRYGQDFSIDDREAVYPPAVVQIQSGLTQEAILARGEDMQQGQQQGQQQQQDLQMQRDPADADQQRPETEENVVTVIFPETGELSELHLPLVNEGTITDAWRIDIPLHVDAETIRSNLQENFNKALQNKEQWPEDINEGYRMMTHVVLQSLYDMDEGEAQPAGLQEQMREQRDQLREQRDQLREQTDQ